MEKSSRQKDKYILSSLNRALKVMDLLSVRNRLGVSEISRLTGYDKASVFKTLYTMEHRGYVIKTADAQYELSEKLSSHGTQAAARQNVTDAAAPVMRRLRDECGESVYLGVLNTNGRVIFMHKEDGYAPDSIRTRTAYEIDAHTNSTGKILLANLDETIQGGLLGMIKLHSHTPQTITSLQKLRQELESLRTASWAEEYDENYPGHSDIAVPIYDADGRCIAALSITCPSATLRAQVNVFRPLLLRAAEDISQKMGWHKH